MLATGSLFVPVACFTCSWHLRIMYLKTAHCIRIIRLLCCCHNAFGKHSESAVYYWLVWSMPSGWVWSVLGRGGHYNSAQQSIVFEKNVHRKMAYLCIFAIWKSQFQLSIWSVTCKDMCSTMSLTKVNEPIAAKVKYYKVFLSLPQLMSAYLCVPQMTLAYVSLLLLTLTYVSLPQASSSYFSLLQLTLAYSNLCELQIAKILVRVTLG